VIRKAAFVLRLAGQDLKGNLAVNAVAAAIIAAAFLTVGVFILVGVNLRALSGHWQEKIRVSVYLKDGMSRQEQNDLEARLKSTPGVLAVAFTSRDQALAEFKTMLGPEADLLDGLDENPLPASFTLSLKPEARGYDQVKSLASGLSALPGIESVDYGGNWIESLASAARLVQAAVFLLGALIIIAIVFIISNTIRLTMYSRKDEIGIMKLVGASNLLVRLPFVLEGMIQGTLAAAAGVVLLWALFRLGLSGLSWPGVFAGFNPVFISGHALAGLIVAGAVIGAAGSMSRFSDFLRV
jgi:cell division transport system permease protein